MVKSDGYIYGRNCSTGGAFIHFNGTGECNGTTITLEDIQIVGTERLSKYKFQVLKPSPDHDSWVTMLLTFSQPVPLSMVSIIAITGQVK